MLQVLHVPGKSALSSTDRPGPGPAPGEGSLAVWGEKSGNRALAGQKAGAEKRGDGRRSGGRSTAGTDVPGRQDVR